MTSTSHRPEASVFFSRDFLSVEFPEIGARWPNRARVYIVVSDAERDRVLARDPGGDVINLFEDRGVSPDFRADDLAFNFDRHLRFMDERELRKIVGAVHATVAHILSRYRVRFYLDEPVSGYPNWEFNRSFRALGALCLHFAPSWVPGYSFFTEDPAQRDPVPLGLLKGSSAVVYDHAKARAAGRGRPLYVINYHILHKRLADIGLTAAKGVYRRLFRRSAGFIDRDPSAHFFHAKALTHSIVGSYRDEIDSNARLLVFPLHYEPEAVLNYFSEFRRQEEIAARLLDSLPLGWQLVLKEHPSQPGALQLPKWEAMRAAKRVVLLRGDYPGSALLARKPTVISIGSTFALEAALAGCPTGILGGVHFRDAPGMVMIDDPSEWPKVSAAPTVAEEAILDWYGDFIDRFCFKGTIMRDRTDFGEIEALIAAFEARLSNGPRA